jgi:hypothetical protein
MDDTVSRNNNTRYLQTVNEKDYVQDLVIDEKEIFYLLVCLFNKFC